MFLYLLDREALDVHLLNLVPEIVSHDCIEQNHRTTFVHYHAIKEFDHVKALMDSIVTVLLMCFYSQSTYLRLEKRHPADVHLRQVFMRRGLMDKFIDLPLYRKRQCFVFGQNIAVG